MPVECDIFQLLRALSRNVAHGAEVNLEHLAREQISSEPVGVADLPSPHISELQSAVFERLLSNGVLQVDDVLVVDGLVATVEMRGDAEVVAVAVALAFWGGVLAAWWIGEWVHEWGGCCAGRKIALPSLRSR